VGLALLLDARRPLGLFVEEPELLVWLLVLLAVVVLLLLLV
jgi:hypothetical protein